MKDIKILDKSNLTVFVCFFNIRINNYKGTELKIFDVCDFNINDLINTFPSFIEKYTAAKKHWFDIKKASGDLKADKNFYKSLKKYWRRLQKWESKASDKVKLLLELGY